MNYLLLVLLVIFSSSLLTLLIRRYSVHKNIMDIPNDRSSHTVATPRGGGLSIVVTFIVTLIFSQFLNTNVVIALAGAGIFVSVVGFLDDQGHIAAKWRLLVHFIAAFWVIYFIGAFTELRLFEFDINLGWLTSIIFAFALVWLLNLFNFMDGIDGIAASEAIFVSASAAILLLTNGVENFGYISVMLAGSTLGFLLLNWPPAKIFMGDVGSGFLGLMLGAIAYADIAAGREIAIWLILFGIFFVDSGITLIRRVWNGDKWYEAHCSHAYQHAARKWGHKRVTIVTILINVGWLLPIAYLVYLNENISLLLTLVAYIPLVLIALKFNAGLTDT